MSDQMTPREATTPDLALCYMLQTHLCYSNITPDALAFRVLRERLDEVAAEVRFRTVAQPASLTSMIQITPQGALAGAFVELVKEAELGRAWWTKSPLLAAVGLANHLDELGWEVRRKRRRSIAESLP